MKIKIGLILKLLLLLSGFWAHADFFKSEFDAGLALKADEFYPRGRKFLFSGYAPLSLTDLPELGFTAAGPGYNMRKLTAMALEAKMPIIYYLEVSYKGEILTHKRFEEFFQDKITDLDWDEIYSSAVKSVKAARKTADDLIVQWNLTPEELRYWRPLELKYLQIVSKAIRDADAKKRPVWMYLPGHYQQKALKEYVPYLDFLGQGMYPNYAKRLDERWWCRFWGEEQQKTIAEAKKSNHKIESLVVPEMFKEPESPEMIPVWVRHDVYTALIMGSKAVVVFSLGQRPNFPSYAKYLRSYSEVAKELTQAPGNLGEVFLFGEAMNDLSCEIVDGPQSLALNGIKDKKLIREFFPLVYADIRHFRGRYFFAVNSHNQALKVRIKNFPAGLIGVQDAISGKNYGSVENGELLLNFSKYEVKLLKFIKMESGVKL